MTPYNMLTVSYAGLACVHHYRCECENTPHWTHKAYVVRNWRHGGQQGGHHKQTSGKQCGQAHNSRRATMRATNTHKTKATMQATKRATQTHTTGKTAGKHNKRATRRIIKRANATTMQIWLLSTLTCHSNKDQSLSL